MENRDLLISEHFRQIHHNDSEQNKFYEDHEQELIDAVIHVAEEQIRQFSSNDSEVVGVLDSQVVRYFQLSPADEEINYIRQALLDERFLPALRKRLTGCYVSAKTPADGLSSWIATIGYMKEKENAWKMVHGRGME